MLHGDALAPEELRDQAGQLDVVVDEQDQGRGGCRQGRCTGAGRGECSSGVSLMKRRSASCQQ
jgi:hypothetical protein